MIGPHDDWRDSPSPMDAGTLHHRDIDAVPCPTCNVDPFDRCRASGGYWSPSGGVHLPRVDRARESLGLPSRTRATCPACSREVKLSGRGVLLRYAKHRGCPAGGRLVDSSCTCGGYPHAYPCPESREAHEIERDRALRARRCRVEAAGPWVYRCVNCDASIDRNAMPRGEWPAARDAFLAAHGWRVEPPK